MEFNLFSSSADFRRLAAAACAARVLASLARITEQSYDTSVCPLLKRCPSRNGIRAIFAEMPLEIVAFEMLLSCARNRPGVEAACAAPDVIATNAAAVTAAMAAF